MKELNINKLKVKFTISVEDEEGKSKFGFESSTDIIHSEITQFQAAETFDNFLERNSETASELWAYNFVQEEEVDDFVPEPGKLEDADDLLDEVEVEDAELEQE